MNRDPNVVFDGSIPENYDRYLGPALFEPYARDLVERLAPRKPKSVLEIACGTGIVTRRLRAQLGRDVYLVATDLNPGMLEFARKKFTDDANIEWEIADAGALPFPDESFEAVVCQFGVMFAPDKEAAMREAFRVLKPGGVFLFNVWDSMQQNAFAQIAHETIASFFERDPPTFYEVPFGMHDARVVRGLLNRAGFDAVELSPVKLPCRSASAADFAIGLVRGNPVSTAIQERKVKIDNVISAVAKKLAERCGSAPYEDTMQALVWSAERIPSL
ncbi:MAG: methyltransferase domain-containing protein [Spartobacteria bacterium]